MMHESGVISFLTLLSVCQSCKCKNLNFWRFLFSREQLSDAYRERKRPVKLPDYEVDPHSAEQMTKRFPSRSTGEPVVERNPKLSSLGAVVKTLEEVGKAMTAEQLVKAMTAKGYWTTRSKRPAGSLRAHLLREIERNGEHARIARAGKMTFTLPNTHP